MRFGRPTKILLVTQVLTVGVSGLLLPIYAVYVERIGGDILDASGARAVFAIIAGVLTIIFAKLTDRVKESEYFIVVGFFLAGFGYTGYLLVQNPIHLFIVQGILGIALATMIPALDGLYAKYMDSSELAWGWGVLEGWWLISEGIAAAIGGFIATYLGFPALFITMAALAFLTAIYVWLLPRELL